MVINNKSFQDILRDKVIELMESERGLQTKLAKAIEKKSSYFSEIKRGNPVNALHLKAIGTIFGSKKVCELLDIANFENDNTSSSSQLDIDTGHYEIIQYFQQKELARKMNWKLVKLEKINPTALKEIDDFIGFKLKLSGIDANGEADTQSPPLEKKQKHSVPQMKNGTTGR